MVKLWTNQEKGFQEATVHIVGSSGGTVTNIDGDYNLEASPEATLLISFIGYESKTVEIGGRSVVNVNLSEDAQSLDEVVVWGYGTAKKKDLTGAISAVSADDIVKSGQTNVLSAVQGKMAGVRIVTGSGAPGGGVDIRIRGNSTIDAGSQPLYVVDGIQLSTAGGPTDEVNPLVDLNPNDIESIQVLKDASATSVYGALGGNGVVLITTKRGVPGKASVTVTAKYGVTELTNSVGYEDAEQFARRQADNFYAKALSQNPGVARDTASIWSWYVDNEYWNQIKPWEDFMFRQATRKELHAIMRGGTKNTNYSLSTGFTNEGGIVENTGLKKLTMRLNLEQKLNKFKVGTNLSYSASKIQGDFNNGNTSLFFRTLEKDPYLQVNVEDLPLEAQALYNQSASEFEDGDDEESRTRQDPRAFLTEQDKIRDQHNLRARLYVDYDITKNFIFHTEASVNYQKRDDDQYFTNNIFKGELTNGYMSKVNNQALNWAYQARLNYNKTLGDHQIDGTAVFEIQEFSTNVFGMEGTNFSNMNNGFNSWPQVGAGSVSIIRQEETTYGTMAGLFRANYIYKNRYNLTASIRNDHNAKFGENNKGAWFPSVALGWTISEEGFLKDSKQVNNLKLRFSTGLTGNSQIPVSSAMNIYRDNGFLPVGDSDTGEPLFFQTQVNNQSVKWEKILQANVGIDASFFNYRVNVTSDYFRTQSKDLLQRVTIPASIAPSPNAYIYQNIGNVSTEGIEFSIDVDVVRTSDINWNIGFNTTFIKSKVNKLNDYEYFKEFNRGTGNTVRLEAGRPLGEWKGYIMDGAVNTEAEAINTGRDPNGLDALSARSNFYDLNGDGIPDSNDQTIIANSTPITTGGLSTSFRWRSFDLYAFFNYSAGNDLINDNLQWAIRDSSEPRVMLNHAIQGAWTATNQEAEYAYTVDHSRDLLSFETEDGSFVRLQNIELGWNAPQSITEKLKISSLRFSVSSNNLWTLTNYSWFDPEVSSPVGGNAEGQVNVAPGLDNTVYPRGKNVLFSLQLGF
ncbi:SusC/RagA family TonB-linked outer membrane protein [Reichenbachiella carrageenanivorans]|uniref:SusC/RagA family TonB-linked outer membrane protein n=1 Tax=Reichenbachiella carrageenanivorans TaxID=2979869 RepID=A0ABY6D490_9BACT|nr:SusC/RagA family TonB-linked outer membrane protein [Reichenbachiella carrageenanivorans]UXX80961.1 SusC/RagA family TonB-linked outer membrane protein [Reichenbachiella carrageenanivorans]